jgi:hypothetical protein
LEQRNHKEIFTGGIEMDAKRKRKMDIMVARNAKIKEIMHEESVSFKEARAILLHREIIENVEDFGE